MKNKFCLSFLTLTSLVVSTQTVIAQTYQPSNRTPVADNTLGTQVSGNGNNSNITGGLNKGQTLFHSFTDFSVPTNGQANFNNPVGNRDIITRVTGGVFSDINGLVNTNGANFFLINPNGITFGTNARLNVGKAFVGSTANGIDLVDAGGRMITFGANPNSDAPLLSIAPNVLFDVSRLTMGGGNGQISNFGTLQTNNPSQYIGLIGGNVTLDGRYGGGEITVPGGRVDLGGVNTAGTVSIDNNGLVFSENGLGRSDLSLINGAQVTVSANQNLGTVDTFFNNATSPGSSLNVTAHNVNIINDFSTTNTGISFLDAGFNKNTGLKTSPGGDVKIDATGKLTLNYGAIYNAIESGAQGNIGKIAINADSIDMTDRSDILARTNGTGNAGNIDIKTTRNISIIGTFDSSLLQGNETQALSSISSSTNGKGNTGKVTINTQGDVLLANRAGIFTNVNETGEGNSQGVSITAKDVSLANLSLIQSSNYGGIGNAGNVDITSTGNISIIGTFEPSLLQGNETQALSEISSITNGKGDSGKVTINTQGNLFLANRGGIFNYIDEKGAGNSQGVSITAKDVSLANLSLIQSSNYGGTGNAGNVDITSTGNISIIGTFEPSLLQGNETQSLSGISSSTNGKGDAGSVKLTAKNAVALVNGDIFSRVEAGGVGTTGGTIEIDAASLSIQDGAQVATSTIGKSDTEPTAGTGDAGNIKVTVTGAVDIAGKGTVPSGIRSTIGTGAIGKGGNITVDAGSFSLRDGARLSTSTAGTGNAGNVKLTANNAVALVNGDIFSRVEAGGVGTTGGTIEIDAASLSIQDGAQVATSTIGKSDTEPTAGQGDAGNITVTVTGAVDIAGDNGTFYSAIFSDVGTGTKGNGGNITVDAGSFSLRDGAELSASNYGTGKAGNLFLTGGKIVLNYGAIFSESLSSTGGNITIKNTDYLLLRNDSFVSTNSDSTGKNGNGGNITINSPLIVATPGNNDISANAYAGDGGKVNITSQGLFGIQYRPKGQESLFTNDITSSSTFGQDGNVNIETPGTDPGRDSTELPNTTTDASNQISQVCSADNRQNKLTVTGRGGLPPNANDPLTSDVVWQDARAASLQPNISSAPTPAKLPPPAVGWVFDGKGKVTLIAAGTQGQTGASVVCPKEG